MVPSLQEMYWFEYDHERLSFLNSIDRCITIGLGVCSQLCINTPTSYTCGCNTGYTLAADNKTCNGKFIF